MHPFKWKDFYTIFTKAPRLLKLLLIKGKDGSHRVSLDHLLSVAHRPGAEAMAMMAMMAIMEIMALLTDLVQSWHVNLPIPTANC